MGGRKKTGCQGGKKGWKKGGMSERSGERKERKITFQKERTRAIEMTQMTVVHALPPGTLGLRLESQDFLIY